MYVLQVCSIRYSTSNIPQNDTGNYLPPDSSGARCVHRCQPGDVRFLSIHDRDTSIAANLVMSGLKRHPRSRYVHRCQPGNVRLLQASTIEIRPSLRFLEASRAKHPEHPCPDHNNVHVQVHPMTNAPRPKRHPPGNSHLHRGTI